MHTFRTEKIPKAAKERHSNHIQKVIPVVAYLGGFPVAQSHLVPVSSPVLPAHLPMNSGYAPVSPGHSFAAKVIQNLDLVLATKLQP